MIKELDYTLKYEDCQFKTNLMIKIHKYMFLFVIFGFILGIYLSTYRLIFISICFAVMLLINIFLLPALTKLLIKDTDFKLIINSQKEYFQVDAKGGYESEYYWAKIQSIKNTKETFIIKIYNRVSIVIPKRIFESEKEMNETWELIQECYNKYKL